MRETVHNKARIAEGCQTDPRHGHILNKTKPRHGHWTYPRQDQT